MLWYAVSIPSWAKTGRHFFKLTYDEPSLGIRDRKELHFFVKNPGGWERDPDVEALRKEFPDATVAVLQQGMPVQELGLSAYAGCADAMILSTHDVPDRNSDGVNFGGTEHFEVGSYGLMHRALIRFDLHALPRNARVEAAYLKAYMYGGTGTRAGDASYPQAKLAYRVLRPWGVGIGNGDLFDKRAGQIRPGECSWKEARRPEMWGAPGCDTPGTDREAEPIAASQCDEQTQDARGLLQPLKKAWVKWDLTAAAKSWAANPDQNFGVLLAVKGKAANAYNNEGLGEAKCDFRSSDYTDPAFRPRLIVVFRK